MPLLVPVLGAHAQELYKLITNSNVTDTIGWDGPTSLNEYQTALLEREVSMRNGEIHMFTIIDPASKSPIGSATVRPEAGTDSGDVGLWIGEPFQGKGIGTRVINELIQYGFQKLNLQKVTGSVFTGNIGSRRAFEKCGFHLEATLPEASLKRGKKLDDWLFAITRETFFIKP
jgi:RimJ/RimL family protein N-acetyltransferase